MFGCSVNPCFTHFELTESKDSYLTQEFFLERKTSSNFSTIITAFLITCFSSMVSLTALPLLWYALKRFQTI